MAIFSDVNPDVVSRSTDQLVINRTAIEKSLETIILTPIGSRVFNRRFGSRVTNILFDPIDSITAGRLQREIQNAVYTWEARISELVVEVLPDVSNQQFYVGISYKVPALGNASFSYSFNLNKGM